MARQFLTITQTDTDTQVALAIKSREQELAAYDMELESHQAAVDAMVGIEWTEKLERYKGLSRDVMIANATNDGMTSEDIQMASELNSRDNHIRAIEAVKIEITKSERIYNDLLARLPEERRAAAFAAAFQQ